MKKMESPKISVIVPSFNQAKFLKDTLQSVVDQNYENLELIVIDGNSTDGSVEVILSFESFITYWVSEPDQGQTHAINKGFRLATGDLICWMNSDDVIEKGVFERLKQLFFSYPEIQIFYGDKRHIDENGNIIRCQRYVPYRLSTFANDKMVMCNQACYWKPSVFEKIGYLDESIRFVMDMEFFIRMGKKGNFKFKHLPEIWGSQRYYEGTKTSDERWRQVWDREFDEVINRYHIKRSRILKIQSIIFRSIYYILSGHPSYLISSKC